MFAVVLLTSIVQSLPSTSRDLVSDRQTFVHMPSVQKEEMWLSQTSLTPGEVAFYRAHVGAHDRYYVFAPASSSPASPQIEAQLVMGLLLLPSVMVLRPDEANVIVAYHAEPTALDLRYSSISQLRAGVAVARVAHAR